MSIPRLQKVEADWWAELSPEGRAEYLEEHPNSKKAQEQRELENKKNKKLTEKEEQQKHDEHVHKSKLPALLTKQQKGLDEDKDKAKEADPKEGKQTLHHRYAEDIKKLNSKDQEFFKSDEVQPNSKARSAVAHHIKKRTGLLVESLKQQGHEWKTGIKAIHKLTKGQKLDDHDKDAVSALAKDMVMVIGSVAFGGHLTLAHGAVALAGSIGKDTVKDIILKAFGHGVAGRKSATPHHSSAYKSYILELAKNPSKKIISNDDDLLREIFEKIADHIQGGHISDKQWGEVIKSMSDGQSKGLDGKKVDTKNMKSLKDRQAELKDKKSATDDKKKSDPLKKATQKNKAKK